jgi:iron complex outermembrane receptor protein
MRLTLAVAVACLTLGGLAAAGDAAAAIRKQTDIPAEGLAPALNELAKDRNFQIVYVTEEIANVRTEGAVGEFTTEEALKRLLTGTGLTYRYLDDKTVTVGSAKMSRERSGSSAKVTSSGSPDDASANQEGKKSSSGSFRVAQVDQGKGSSTSSVGQQSFTSPGATNSTSGGPSGGLEEIVVTAQKRAERLQDVPIAISVLGGKALDESTFSGVTEALNTLPNVAAFPNQLQSGGTILSIRGVSPSSYSAAGSSTVGYYIDSVPFGQINAAVVPDPNVYDLQQIEVLRGPQGTLYGANALNGVVRVLTRDPDLNVFDFKAHGDVSTAEGGGANYTGDAAANVPIIDGKLAARATFGSDHQSGWINGPLGEHLNSTQADNVRLKVSAQATDALSISLSAWHSQSAMDAPSMSGSDHNVTNVNPQPMYTQFNAFGAKVNYDLPRVLISSTTSYVDYDTSSGLDYSIIGLNDVLFSRLNSRVIAEELNLTSKLDGPWLWSAGAMYRDAKDHNYYSLNPQPVQYPPVRLLVEEDQNTSKSAAVYGELGEHFFHNEFQWSLGVRYFHDDEGTLSLASHVDFPASQIVPTDLVSATSSATTPRAVLSWFPRKDFSGYVSYSQGFRSGLPQSARTLQLAPDFAAAKPDKLTNYEIGVKGSLWNQAVSYDAAVFYIDWRDIQQSLSILLPGGFGYATVLTNGQSAGGAGAEFSLSLRPIDGLALTADFGWNNLHFEHTVYSGGSVLFPEGSRPNFSPEYTGGLSAKYSFALGAGGVQGAISVSGNYISPLNTTYVNATPSTEEGNSLLLTRARIGIETPDHWSVGLFVNNASNWNGSQVPHNGAPNNQWDPRVQPRTYGVSFDYHLR